MGREVRMHFQNLGDNGLSAEFAWTTVNIKASFTAPLL